MFRKDAYTISYKHSKNTFYKLSTYNFTPFNNFHTFVPVWVL